MNEISGYKGIGPNAGIFVPAADAFHYAASECGVLLFKTTAPLADEFKQLLLDWYFSGNWIKIRGNEDMLVGLAKS